MQIFDQFFYLRSGTLIFSVNLLPTYIQLQTKLMKGPVSRETVVPCLWGSETQKFGIQLVDIGFYYILCVFISVIKP